MPLTEKERAQVDAIAKAQGLDPDALAAAVEDLAAKDNGGAPPEPGKNDAAAPGAHPVGAESGAKAHGGRGYFAYEYPFLKVNQVLESLFLPVVPDGDMFTGDWLAKHGGGSTGSSGSSTPAQ